MFEKATRGKYRYPYRGSCTTEDLWDLDVQELDEVFKLLNLELKGTQEESLLTVNTKDNEVLAAKVAIVRHVVEVKLQEAENKKLAKEKKARKQRLLEVLANKQDTELQGKSTEELQKMIDEL